MIQRRTLLASGGVLFTPIVSGCLDTLSGGRLSGGVDSTQLSARRGEIVDVYADAVERRNDGIRTRDDAIIAFNEESYDQAINQFETAIKHFEAAEQGFADAASLAHELGEDEAGAICEAAEEDAGLQIAATEAGLSAAEAADGDGTNADVNRNVEEYRDLLEQAEEVPVEDPQALVEVIESG